MFSDKEGDFLLKALPIIKKTKLFSGLSDTEIESLIAKMDSRIISFKKGDIIYSASVKSNGIFIVLEGSVILEKNDICGNRCVISDLSVCGIFGLPYAVLPNASRMMDATAAQDSIVLFLNINAVLQDNEIMARYPDFLRNLLIIIASKLASEVEHPYKNRTTRMKLLSFLCMKARKAGRKSFDIVFTRQELADYLGVQRSAMCTELARLKQDGLIDFNRNHFTVFFDEPFNIKNSSQK